LIYVAGTAILTILCSIFFIKKEEKLARNKLFFIGLIIFYVSIFTLQINQPPFERYPGWDWFWGDVTQAGKLISLKLGLSNFELPIISPYVNFGWNFAGDTSPTSFLSPLNLTILALSARDVIFIRTMVFLILAGIGVYLFLRFLTGDDFLSFFGGISYVSLPIIIGLFYYTNTLSIFCLVPFLLYLTHKVMENNSIRNTLFIVGFLVFAVSSGDVYTLVAFPIVIGVYSFLMSLGFYHNSLIGSLKKTVTLLILFCLSGAFYILPLYKNLHTISMTENLLKRAGFLPPSISLGLRGFLRFFYHYGFESLFKPIEGSGFLLYAPVFLCAGIIISLVFKRVVFMENSKQFIASTALVLTGLSMFLVSVAFYLIPNISKSGKGVLRYHINLFPFMILLAGFVCFAAITKLKNGKKIKIFALIAFFSFAIDYYLFVIPHPSPDTYLFNVRHGLFDGFLRSSDLIKIRVLEDMWLILPWINIFFILFITFYAFNNKFFSAKKSTQAIYLIIAMALPLFSISIHNELRLQQHRWQIVFRDPSRRDSYLKRKECIDSQINRQDINYRTLFVGKKEIDNSGQNWKLLAETELNVWGREKALFAYRETMHPYTGLLYSPLSSYSYFATSNLWPPVSTKAAENIDMLKLMGVKYIISAEEKIESPFLIYRGECMTEDSRNSVILGSDGGLTYLYELKNPFAIAFLVDRFKKLNFGKSTRAIWKKGENPWMNNEVYLEEDPQTNKNLLKDEIGVLSTNFRNETKIEKETFNSIQLNVKSNAEKFLVLSYIYRPFWKAYIGSKKAKIYRAYGGFMCVKVPPGESTVRFKYVPRDVYLGLLLTLSAFFLPFMPKSIHSIWEKYKRKR